MNPRSTEALLRTLRESLGPALVVSVSGHPAYRKALKDGSIVLQSSVTVRNGVLVLARSETRTEHPRTGHWRDCACDRCKRMLAPSPTDVASDPSILRNPNVGGSDSDVITGHRRP